MPCTPTSNLKATTVTEPAAAPAPAPPTRERLLEAAARLFARRGYNAVGIADVGAEIGMSGAALYRHFPNKAAVLVEMCERVISEVIGSATTANDEARTDDELLQGLVGGQLDMVINHREVLIVYLREMSSVPDADLRRMRRKQRLYLEEWMHALAGLRPNLGENERRTLVHAAIGVLHSAAQYEPGLDPSSLRETLQGAAYRVLGVPAPTDPSPAR